MASREAVTRWLSVSAACLLDELLVGACIVSQSHAAQQIVIARVVAQPGEPRLNFQRHQSGVAFFIDGIFDFDDSYWAGLRISDYLSGNR